ncbi:MAG: hypothetical protein ABEK29_06270, partial [Bradymonadaceae bacterium]
MAQTTSSLAVVLLATGLAVGCGEDPPNNDFDVGADARKDTEMSDVNDTGESDTQPDDAGPDTTMDTGGDTAMDTGEMDTAMDSGLEDTGDTSPMDVADTGVDGGSDGTDATDTMMADTAGEVGTDTYPTTFGAGSFISEFYIDKENPSTPRCCFDVQVQGTDQDYDADADNAIAEFLKNVGSAAGLGIGDANARINAGIKRGDFIYLFEFMNWDGTNWQSDSSITMYSHPGANANTPWSSSEWSTVEMGNGSFEIESASYDASGAPKSELTNVSTSADGSGADLE